MFARIIFSGAVVLALAIGVFATGDALARKGGRLDTTIAMSPQTLMAAGTEDSGEPVVYGDAIFTVTRSIPYDKDTIWVTNKCWDSAGNLIVDRDTAVVWGTSVSLVGSTNPMPTDGVSCVAYVTLRPWKDRVLGDSVMSYSVGQ